MLLQDTIGEHLLEVDTAAREREEVILKQLEEKEPLPDKEKNQIAWVSAAFFNGFVKCFWQKSGGF